MPFTKVVLIIMKRIGAILVVVVKCVGVAGFGLMAVATVMDLVYLTLGGGPVSQAMQIVSPILAFVSALVALSLGRGFILRKI